MLNLFNRWAASGGGQCVLVSRQRRRNPHFGERLEESACVRAMASYRPEVDTLLAPTAAGGTKLEKLQLAGGRLCVVLDR